MIDKMYNGVKKNIYEKIKENSHIVYFVNPIEFNTYVKNWNYFEVLDENIAKK